MPGKERSLFKMIFTSFINSLKPNIFRRPKLMGEDYYGTKYYEIPPSENVSRKYSARYFEPTNKTDFEQQLPAEWEAWLRHRRKHPPTKEEIERNYEMQLIKKENAEKIKAKYLSDKLEDTKLLTQNTKETSFQTFEEYKNPGKDYKINVKK
ncbi:Mimitin, mitochondrial [Habropoda laboriosa]|uniref:Mimitin, mitochondrial n=1 Tax=Habropoda laboriosa TaxID=597456 RepID=A0A0L7QKQ5_9HYME|nr:PREDICTED: mimitin, mitochondrial [Habropoda laboriosa]KOC59192.1 Mimitin, mitochondrial [Habropoda laboriosa]